MLKVGGGTQHDTATHHRGWGCTGWGHALDIFTTNKQINSQNIFKRRLLLINWAEAESALQTSEHLRRLGFKRAVVWSAVDSSRDRCTAIMASWWRHRTKWWNTECVWFDTRDRDGRVDARSHYWSFQTSKAQIMSNSNGNISMF